MQVDLNKVLKVIQSKVLKGTHLPVNINGIQTGCLINSYFKDIYLHLTERKLSHAIVAIRKVETLAKKNVLLDSLFFKLITSPGQHH